MAPPPPPNTRKLGTGAIVGIVVGAVVLACCGLAAIGAIFGGDTEPAAQASPSAQAVAAPAVSSAVPTPVAPATTAASPSAPATTAPPPPTTVVMPNLVGMNAAVAEDKLKQLGLTNIKFGSQDEHDTLVILPANWTVTKQSHKKGTKVGLDDLVVLTCTKQR